MVKQDSVGGCSGDDEISNVFSNNSITFKIVFLISNKKWMFSKLQFRRI